jgi:hypothetical protein
LKATKIKLVVKNVEKSSVENSLIPKYTQEFVLKRFNDSNTDSYSSIDNLKLEIKLQ